MNKEYVVAYLSLFDGEIKQEQIYASSPFMAAKSYLGLAKEDLPEQTLDAIYDYCSNTDCFINVLEINKPRSGRSGNGLQTQVAEFDSPAAFH